MNIQRTHLHALKTAVKSLWDKTPLLDPSQIHISESYKALDSLLTTSNPAYSSLGEKPDGIIDEDGAAADAARARKSSQVLAELEKEEEEEERWDQEKMLLEKFNEYVLHLLKALSKEKRQALLAQLKTQAQESNDAAGEMIGYLTDELLSLQPAARLSPQSAAASRTPSRSASPTYAASPAAALPPPLLSSSGSPDLKYSSSSSSSETSTSSDDELLDPGRVRQSPALGFAPLPLTEKEKQEEEDEDAQHQPSLVTKTAWQRFKEDVNDRGLRRAIKTRIRNWTDEDPYYSWTITKYILIPAAIIAIAFFTGGIGLVLGAIGLKVAAAYTATHAAITIAAGTAVVSRATASATAAVNTFRAKPAPQQAAAPQNGRGSAFIGSRVGGLRSPSPKPLPGPTGDSPKAAASKTKNDLSCSDTPPGLDVGRAPGASEEDDDNSTPPSPSARRNSRSA